MLDRLGRPVAAGGLTLQMMQRLPGLLLWGLLPTLVKLQAQPHAHPLRLPLRPLPLMLHFRKALPLALPLLPLLHPAGPAAFRRPCRLLRLLTALAPPLLSLLDPALPAAPPRPCRLRCPLLPVKPRHPHLHLLAMLQLQAVPNDRWTLDP